MKVKAKVSFCGAISMGLGQVADIADKGLLDDLLKAGYVEPVDAKKAPEKAEKAAAPKRKAVKANGNK